MPDSTGLTFHFKIREWRLTSHTNQTHITQIHIFNFNLGFDNARIIDRQCFSQRSSLTVVL